VREGMLACVVSLDWSMPARQDAAISLWCEFDWASRVATHRLSWQKNKSSTTWKGNQSPLRGSSTEGTMIDHPLRDLAWRWRLPCDHFIESHTRLNQSRERQSRRTHSLGGSQHTTEHQRLASASIWEKLR
jgi:hypothetical protein